MVAVSTTQLQKNLAKNNIQWEKFPRKLSLTSELLEVYSFQRIKECM